MLFVTSNRNIMNVSFIMNTTSCCGIWETLFMLKMSVELSGSNREELGTLIYCLSENFNSLGKNQGRGSSDCGPGTFTYSITGEESLSLEQFSDGVSGIYDLKDLQKLATPENWLVYSISKNEFEIVDVELVNSDMIRVFGAWEINLVTIRNQSFLDVIRQEGLTEWPLEQAIGEIKTTLPVLLNETISSYVIAAVKRSLVGSGWKDEFFVNHRDFAIKYLTRVTQ